MQRRSDLQPMALSQGWQLCSTPPGQWASPSDAPSDAPWLAVPALGPVAEVLQQLGLWSLDAPARRFDAEDWWYRLRFDLPDGAAAHAHVLGLDGLATVAEVWLNGAPLLQGSNMFLAHARHLADGWRPRGNELWIACRSLDHDLGKRRPRPRWRAPMIEHQQLRWPRTTVLGRTPGWSPPCAVVGPWRPVWLAPAPHLVWQGLRCHAQTQAHGEGWQGRLHLALTGLQAGGVPVAGEGHDLVASVEVQLRHGSQVITQALSAQGPDWSTDVVIDAPALWWPHTHGEPALYEASVLVTLQGHALPTVLDLGRVGFRHLALDRAGDGFGLRVNGVPVFCRGACWTPLNPVTLDAAAPADYTAALQQVRDAGMNMVRVGGTMHYEADAFYDACDAMGVMVWQEFMFANMDYPEDPAWVDGVRAEAQQQLQRWQGRPALTVLCGNSEVEQQAAMFGATRERWAPALFHATLAELSQQACPDVPYWPSSAHGGSFPHQGDVGTTSYYGVGAYQRPLDDARRSGLRFATECLALANVPEAATIARMPGGLSLRVHHPAWKARAPRDLGAGWDFEDVRDHYLAERFQVDPAKLRYSDHDRYLMLSRITSGELMGEVFAEWRRGAATCQGALIWFLRDLWPGAGWGVIDSTGRPKAAYHGLKRSLQPTSLAVTDEGGNGLYVHLGNEGPHDLAVQLRFTAWRHGEVDVGHASCPMVLPPRSQRSVPLMQLFDWFVDWSWAYRFGPATAQVLSFALHAQDDERVLARATAFPAGWVLPLHSDLGLRAHQRSLADGRTEVRLTTTRFAQSVHFDVDGHVPDDAYFHLAPGEERCITFTPESPGKPPLSGAVLAVNLAGSVSIAAAAAKG